MEVVWLADSDWLTEGDMDWDWDELALKDCDWLGEPEALEEPEALNVAVMLGEPVTEVECVIV
jgi:hypothetical protein